MTREQARALVAESWAAGIRPAEKMSIVEWAERHIVLDSRSSRIEGPFRVRHTPYLREILETLSPDCPVAEVATMKGGQLGFTLMAHLWLLFLIDQAPANIFTVMPTVDDAKDTSKTKFDPLVEASELMRSKIAPARARDSGNTIMMKQFPGGAAIFAGANSGSRFRSRSGPWLFLDEVDGYPVSVGEEGDPVSLAKRFTTTYPRRKHLYVSTPTIAGRSRIEALFNQGDRSRFFVPCPLCGEMQTLIFQDRKSGRFGLRWEGTAPNLRAWYECVKCHGAIEESRKAWMLDHGVWRAEDPKLSQSFRSFHLSSLYSPPGTISWQNIATRFLAEKDVQEKLRIFMNHVLGEPWEDRGDAPDWEVIYGRRERYEQGVVPKGGLVLTAGADVQQNRIEVEVVAWGPRLESWSVDYVVILGDIATDDPWRQLDALLARPFRHASGATAKIRMMAVDSGYGTQHVYNWVRKRPIGQAIAVKGSDSLPVLVGGHPTFVDVKSRGGTVRRGAQLWHVGSSVAKRELYSFLRARTPEKDGEPRPIGLCHFPEYGPDHFKQLTAEELTPRKNPRGYLVYEWIKVRERNEALDARVYCRAAAAIVGIDRWTDGDWARAAAAMSAPQSSGNAGKTVRPPSSYGNLGIDRWRRKPN